MFIPETTRALIRLALAEDMGRGDCTTDAIFEPDVHATATILIKQSARVAGLFVVEEVFAALSSEIETLPLVAEGTDIPNGRTAVCRVSGPARAVLAGERTALNFLARLSGVATGTREAVRELTGTSARLLDTRKTTPGWRWLEKYAVRVGGGHNHRFGLDDMVLIKDNHIALCGGIAPAVERARAHVGLSTKIEVEVDTLEQLAEALDVGVDLILLDNMDLDTLRQAVELTANRAALEASGNLTVGRLAAVAQTGVQYLSMGALTHSAISVDVGLDIGFA